MEAVTHLFELLNDFKPSDLLIRRLKVVGPATPADMYGAIMDFLDEYRRRVARGDMS